MSQGKETFSTRVDIINTQHGRILCVADIRGSISLLNQLAHDHNASAIIHTGDFGFYEPSSLPSISDRTLKHLVQYSSLISPAFRSLLLSNNTNPATMREMLLNPPKDHEGFGLSEFPKLLSGDIKLDVPVYTVWGACEDVSIIEKIRIAPNSPVQTGPNVTAVPIGYSIPNLTVLDEATTRVLVIGGLRLRLFGLGGAVVNHKLFDNGQGQATIAGGSGTMWTTVLQIGELVDTAQKVYDPAETRILVTHASPGREGLLNQLALVLRADFTVSAGLHFRYGVSYNDFSVQGDSDTYLRKLTKSKTTFGELWESVKPQVDSAIDDNQRALLKNALTVTDRLPAVPSSGASQHAEETAWKNTWNWNLPDAAFGTLVLDIKDGRVGSEMKSQGFNFAYRTPKASQHLPRSTSSAAAASSSSVGGAPQQNGRQVSQHHRGGAPKPSQQPSQPSQQNASKPATTPSQKEPRPPRQPKASSSKDGQESSSAEEKKKDKVNSHGDKDKQTPAAQSSPAAANTSADTSSATVDWSTGTTSNTTVDDGTKSSPASGEAAAAVPTAEDWSAAATPRSPADGTFRGGRGGRGGGGRGGRGGPEWRGGIGRGSPAGSSPSERGRGSYRGRGRSDGDWSDRRNAPAPAAASAGTNNAGEPTTAQEKSAGGAGDAGWGWSGTDAPSSGNDKSSTKQQQNNSSEKKREAPAAATSAGSEGWGVPSATTGPSGWGAANPPASTT